MGLISVAIPSRARPGRLAATLRALSRQRLPARGFEVVVADDGAGEASRVVSELAPSFPVSLRSVAAPRPGPAAARNAAIAEVRGSVVLFLGDDTVPATEDLVERHAALHAGEASSLAVLGRVVWDERRKAATQFMRWLGETGVQFAFDTLQPGPVDTSRFFYSSHVSIRREDILAVGGFDERFSAAAGEDVELGARLADAGMRLEYHPELVVLHDHPMTLEDSLDRMRLVGSAAALLGRVHPERRHPDARPADGLRWRALSAGEPVLRAAEQAPFSDALRPFIWRLLHLEAYGRGYRSA